MSKKTATPRHPNFSKKLWKAPFLIAFAFPVFGHAQEQLEETVFTSESPAPVVSITPAPRPVRPATAPEPVVIEPEIVVEPLIISDVNVLRTGTPILDLPRSVSVFSEERIDDQGIRSIGEIVDYTPGVTTSQGEGHRDSIVFRGQPRSTADFFIDGIRDDVQYYRGLYNIEQVEILRGPSALVFGRGGTGGILNRVTKKPVIGYNFTHFDATVDTFGGNLTQFDWNQSLGGSNSENLGKGGGHLIEEPTAAFRLNGFFESLSNHRDFFDGNRVGVNPTLALQLTPDTRLDLSYEYNNHERFIDRGIPTGPDGLPVQSLVDTVFGDPEQNFSAFESHAIRATLSHEFSDTWKGRLTAFYGDYDKSYPNFYASGYNAATDQVTIDGYIDNTFRENLVLSGDLVGIFETGFIEHKVLIGGEYAHTSSNQNRFNSFWDTTGADKEVFAADNFRLNNGASINAAGNLATNSFSTDLNDDTRVNINTYSFFVQDEIALSEHLDFVIGARFDSFDIEVFNALNGETRTRRDDEISPRLGLIIKPVENVSIYGSFSESFLPRSGEQFADINGNSNILDPDTFTNLEAGVKWDIQPGLSFRTAIFEIEQSSPQVADSNPETLDIIDTSTSGFEAELTGNLTDRWFISTGYTYLEAEQVNRAGPSGLRPREVPEHTFSVWNQYAVNERLGLALGVIFQDDSFANNGNTAILPDYTRVDAAVFYKLSERYRLQMNIENLFDTQYFPNSHSTHEVSVGKPVNAAFSIRGNF